MGDDRRVVVKRHNARGLTAWRKRHVAAAEYRNHCQPTWVSQTAGLDRRAGLEYTILCCCHYLSYSYTAHADVSRVTHTYLYVSGLLLNGKEVDQHTREQPRIAMVLCLPISSN